MIKIITLIKIIMITIIRHRIKDTEKGAQYLGWAVVKSQVKEMSFEQGFKSLDGLS